MAELENAVRRLAMALDTLEAKLDDRLQDLTAANDAVDAARRHARAAQAQTRRASDALAAAIGDLRGLLGAHATDASGVDAARREPSSPGDASN